MAAVLRQPKQADDITLQNRVMRSQKAKKYYDVTKRGSSLGVRIGSAPRYWKEHPNYIYLPTYYIVGNEPDLVRALKVIDYANIGSVPNADQVARGVVASWGIRPDNYNNQNQNLLRALQEEQQAKSVESTKKQNVTAAEKRLKQEQYLAALDTYISRRKLMKGTVFPAKVDKSKSVLPARRTGGVTLAERVEEAKNKSLRENEMYVVNVNKLEVKDPATGRILKSLIPLNKLTDRSKNRTVPGTYVASNNLAKFTQAIRLLNLPNADAVIKQFASGAALNLASPSFSNVVSAPASQIQPMTAVGSSALPLPAVSPPLPLPTVPTVSSQLPLPTVPTVSSQLPLPTVPPQLSPTVSAVTLPSVQQPTVALSAATLPSVQQPTVALSAATLPAPTLGSPRRVLPTVQSSPTTRISPRTSPSLTMPPLSSPGRV